jgi:dihydropteroate synthase
MHSLGVPPIRLKTISQSVDCIEFLLKWGGDRIKMLEGKGISRERLIFDPGIGFGKTIDQNLKIINKAHKFLDLGVRVLIGHSRKSFLNHITVKPFSERDVESLVLSIELAKQKIHYLRVHQVEWHSRAFRTLHLSEQTR